MGIAAADVGREVPGGSQAPEDEGSLGIKPRRGGVWGWGPGIPPVGAVSPAVYCSSPARLKCLCNSRVGL